MRVIVGVICRYTLSPVVGVTSYRLPPQTILSPACGTAYGRLEVRPMKSTGLTSTTCPTPVSMYCGARLLRRSVTTAEDAPRRYVQDSPANAKSDSVACVTASSKPVAICSALSCVWNQCGLCCAQLCQASHNPETRLRVDTGVKGFSRQRQFVRGSDDDFVHLVSGNC